MCKIVKRDGRVENLDRKKIEKAIGSANILCKKRMTAEELSNITSTIVSKIKDSDSIEVENVHSLVEYELLNNDFEEVSSRYSSYRRYRSKTRLKKTTLMKQIHLIGVKTDRDNANVGNNFSAKLLRIASESNKVYNLASMPKELAKLHENGDLYLHDLDSFNLTINCIAEDEYILVKDEKGISTWIQFKDLQGYFAGYVNEVVQPKNLWIYGRMGWTKIRAVTRRKLEKNEILYKFKTRRNKGLKATGKHRIPIVRNGIEALINAEDIVKKDRLIQSRSEEDTLYELPVLDILMDNLENIKFGITVQNCQKLYHWLKYEYGKQFEFKFTTGERQSCKGTGLLSGVEYKKISDEFYIPYEVKRELSVTVSKGKKILPAYIPITPYFCRLIGYILAEGHLNTEGSNRCINIANINPKILADIDSCVSESFNDKCTDVHDRAVSNRIKAKVLNGSIYVTLFEAMGLKVDAGHIDIPDFIMNGNTIIKSNFLFGLFDGDGSYSKICITYSTACEKFRDKLSILLKSMNIEHCSYLCKCKGQFIYSRGKCIGKRNYDAHVLKILDVDSIKQFLKVVGSYKRDDLIEKYAAQTCSANNSGDEIMDILKIDGYEGYVYDLETDEHWFMVNNYIVHNCLNLPTGELLKSGFNTGYGFIRPAQRIESAGELSCILLQSTQNDMFGGQSHPNFDNDLAPFVENTRKEIRKELEELCKLLEK